MPKVQKKHKEKPLDFSLFDDDTDIFADLTDTFKPKQKLKTKPEAKSIFDDDMGEFFEKQHCFCLFSVFVVLFFFSFLFFNIVPMLFVLHR